MSIGTTGLIMLVGVVIVVIAIYFYDKNKHIGKSIH